MKLKKQLGVIKVDKKEGKLTAASFMIKLLGVAWYLNLVFGAFLIGGHLYLLIVKPSWLGESMRLQIETPGLVFIFTEGFSAPDTGTLFIFQFALILPLLAMGLLIIYHLRKIFITILGYI
jgi:hypothetical protein